MAEFLELMRTWVESIILALGYSGIALVMLVENLFPPIPSEVIMPFAGFLVADGRLSFVGVIIAGTIGAGSGAVVIYYIGMKVSDAWLRQVIRKYGKFLLLSENDLDKTTDAFLKHGSFLILAGRVIPGIRSLISLPAGHHRMPFVKFIIFTLIGTVAWNLLLAGAGYILGQNWERVLDMIDAYETGVIIIGILFLAAFIGFRVYQMRNEEKEGAN